MKYPNKPNSGGAKRHQDENQQLAKAIRPQLPRDASQDMKRWAPGMMPKGGYRSVFDFSEGPYSTKKSPSRAGGRKVIKEAC